MHNGERPAEHRPRNLVFARMPKSQAKALLELILRPINGGVGRPPDTSKTFQQFVENVYHIDILTDPGQASSIAEQTALRIFRCFYRLRNRADCAHGQNRLLPDERRANGGDGRDPCGRRNSLLDSSRWANGSGQPAGFPASACADALRSRCVRRNRVALSLASVPRFCL